jgi:hypothetical protein
MEFRDFEIRTHLKTSDKYQDKPVKFAKGREISEQQFDRFGL